jgi:hypothetical protein
MSDESSVFGYLFGIGFDVMVATIDATTGIITAQIGDAVSGVVDSNNAEVWQNWGFASLPTPPIGGASGAQGIAIKRHTGDLIIAGRDPRTGQIWGNLKPGEVVVFASGADGKAQGRVLIKQDGSVTLYTTDSNTASGNAMMVRLSPPNTAGGGGFEVAVPGASLKLGPSGFHVTAGTAQLSMGSIQGLPGPLSALGSYFTCTAGTFTADAPMVLLGPSLTGTYASVTAGIPGDPLSMPPIPIISGFPGTPLGLACCSGVFVSYP